MCGARLMLACPECGTPSDPNLNFCGACGARLEEARDVEASATPPPATPESAAEWASAFRAVGWGPEAFEEHIRGDLSRSLSPRKGEGIVLAGRSSIDFHVFWQGFDASAMLPIAGFMGTNDRLIIFTSRPGSRRLDVLLQIEYGDLAEVIELKGSQAHSDLRQLDGLLRLSLRQRPEPLDIMVLNASARAPLLGFLRAASSAGIAAPAGLQPQKAPSGPPVRSREVAAQGAAARKGREAPRQTANGGAGASAPAPGHHSRALRIAATILGVIGGIAGGIGATVAIVMGGISTAFGDIEGASITDLGYVALGLSILGVVGGAISIPKPRAAGVFMLVSGIGGAIAVSLAYAFGGALLVVGGILAFLGTPRPRTGQDRGRPTLQ